MSKVIVIGGGAAGMMAAIAAAQKGHKVILLEKNEKLGKKLFITGKGRCNVTNAADMDVLFQNICTNEKFLYSAFYGFDNTRVCDLLEQAGCPLKTERGDRVFPVSDHSSDVIAALQRELRKYQVDVHLHTEVIKILTKETDGNPVFCGVECADHKKIAADDCIVCTGGCSYASTGSTGDGYRFAEETGHKVTERKPALVPLEIRENWCRELMGLSLKNVEIRMQCGKKTWYEGFGEMLFTHFGVSGPLILSASSFYSKNLSKRKGGDEVKLFLDLKPALTPEQLDKRLLRDFEEAKNKQFKNALDHLVPCKADSCYDRVVRHFPGEESERDQPGREKSFRLIDQGTTHDGDGDEIFCGSNHHSGGNLGKGYQSFHHGIQTCTAFVFCRGSIGSGCHDRGL